MNKVTKRNQVKKKSTARMREPSHGTSVPEGILLMKNALIGAVIAFALALLLLLLTTVIVSRAKDPLSWVVPLAIGTLYLTAMIAGIIARQFHRQTPIACGLLAGVILLLLCMAFSLFIPQDLQTTEEHLWIHIIAPLFAVMGAYIGHFHPPKHRKKRR